MNSKDGTVHERAKAVSDAAIRRSLLGCADTAEQDKFETLLMLDEQFEKRVYRLELELTDDFSFGSLSETERQLFNTRFLVTRGRLRELTVSQALAQATSKWECQGQQLRRPWRPSFLSLFPPDRPFTGYALATIALVFFGLLFLLSLKVPSPRAPLISKRQKQVAIPEKQFAHPVANQSVEIKSGDDSSTNQQPTVLNLVLQPDSNSSNTPSLLIASAVGEAATVRLELLVDNSDKIPYEASLMTEDGQQVTSFSELQAAADDPTKVAVTLPAQLLKDGTYYLNLVRTSDNTSRSLRYCFQVKRD